MSLVSGDKTENTMPGKNGKASGLKPGQRAPYSGLYRIDGPCGGQGPERTVVQGDPMPPTPKPGSAYRLVDPADNGAGRSKR